EKHRECSATESELNLLVSTRCFFSIPGVLQKLQNDRVRFFLGHQLTTKSNAVCSTRPLVMRTPRMVLRIVGAKKIPAACAAGEGGMVDVSTDQNYTNL